MGDRNIGRISAIFIFVTLFVSCANSFYLPGVAPRDFARGDELQVKVNKLSSIKTQLPYDFYYLKYCKPNKIDNVAENLGEVLRGDRIENSVYSFNMRDETSCIVACKSSLDAEAAKKFQEKINDEYRVNMILDNLPVAVVRQRRDEIPTTTYEHGFPVGFKGNYAGSKEDKYFINNHLSFRVMFHRDPETDSARIVGFEVTPSSINHEIKEWDDKNPNVPTCNQNTKNMIPGSTVPQEVDTGKDVVFTYDVTFKLCAEDYQWWWRAYLTAGSSALYLFAYSAFYFFTKLEITKLVSGFLYFGYMLIASFAFFFLTGSIGFYACFWFVRKIYASVKID